MKKISIILSLLIALTATCIFPSCNKDSVDEPEPEQTIDVELYFHQDYYVQVHKEVIQHWIDNHRVRNIYLVIDEDEYTNLTSKNISNMRQSLQERLDMSPKVHGRGNFRFKIGEASKVPEDSLWYVQQGWTINKHLTENN